MSEKQTEGIEDHMQGVDMALRHVLATCDALTDDQLLEAIGELHAWCLAHESATASEQSVELERIVAKVNS